MKKNKKTSVDPCNVGSLAEEFQENVSTPQQLASLGWDDGISRKIGVGDWGGTGVGTEQTGVGDQNLFQQAELPIYQRADGDFGVASERIAPQTTAVEEEEEDTVTAPQAAAVEEEKEEEVAVLAMVLANEAICPDKDELATIRRLYSPASLNAACKRLSPERHAQIKEWVAELNAIAQAEQEAEEAEKANPIQVGSRVRYTYPHSKRCGMVGTVKKIAVGTATIWLDYHNSLSFELRELVSALTDLELLALGR